MLETKVNINNLLKPNTPHNIFYREKNQEISVTITKNPEIRTRHSLVSSSKRSHTHISTQPTITSDYNHIVEAFKPTL